MSNKPEIQDVKDTEAAVETKQPWLAPELISMPRHNTKGGVGKTMNMFAIEGAYPNYSPS